MKKIFSLLALVMTCQAFAQTLPPPSREIFRCERDGKVVYSDAPCLGAKKVDIVPARGLNKSTGTERIGTDVWRERHNEQMAQAMHPIFGESADQRAKRYRRAALSPQSKAQCDRLDQQIPVAEKAEKQATQEELKQVQEQLLRLRKQFVDIRC